MISILFYQLIIQITCQEFQVGELQDVLFINSIQHKLTLPHIAGDYIESSVIFSQPFSEIPELILSPSYISSGPYNSFERGFILKIISITKKGFITRIIAPSEKQVYSACFRWIAFVDPKIHVIFDQISSPVTVIKTYNHDNINFKKMVPIICSFVYNANTPYTLDITLNEVTKLDFTISILVSGLTDISYQLVLYENDIVWQLEPTFYLPMGNLFDYPFEILNQDIPSNCLQQQVYGIPVMSTLNAIGFLNLRYQIKYETITDKLSFSIGSWDTSSFGYGLFNYMIFSCKVNIFPLFVYSFSFSEISDNSQSSQFEIFLPQLQLYLTSSLDYIETDETFIGFTIIVTAQCKAQQYQNFWVFGTTKSNRKYFNDQILCTSTNNIIKYDISFNDNDRKDYKRIKVIIQQNNLEVIQILNNRKKDQQYQLFKIEVENI